METRIAKLEESMAEVRARLEQCATKADVEALRAEMHKGFADMVKWIVGTAIVMGGTGIVVMTFVLNNAVPKAPPPAPLPPVVVYTQPAPAAAPAPAPAPVPPRM